MMHSIDPDMIVYAGGMISTGDWFLKRIQHHVHRRSLSSAGVAGAVATGRGGGRSRAGRGAAAGGRAQRDHGHEGGDRNDAVLCVKPHVVPYA